MKYQYNRMIIVSDHELVIETKELSFIEHNKSVYLYYINDNDVIALMRSEYKHRVIQYLNHFILLLPNDYTRQFNFWNNLYECIGDDYESLINVNINKACIKLMIDYIQDNRKISDDSLLLDFGCGTGISQYVHHKGKIIGYEPVYEMRKQAQMKGLSVYSCIDKISEESLDAVFSSFVLHMGIQESEIQKVARKMKTNAIWISNFYDGINEDIINSYMLKTGLRLTQLQEYNKIGRLYEYRK